MNKPQFRAVPGFPGYEVSPEGDVQCWIRRGRTLERPVRIIPFLSGSNRWHLKLMRDKVGGPIGSRERVTVSLAATMLRTFVGNPPDDSNGDVDFVDDNPYNINLPNLRWRKSLQSFKDLT